MKNSLRLLRCFCVCGVIAILTSAFIAPQVVHAADGTWNTTTSGLSWSTPGNWLSSTVADGSGSTANFNTLDITADTTVHLDTPRTIGNLIFGDVTVGTAGGWILDNNGSGTNVLTLAGGTPTITVNALGTGKNATISLELAGTAGMTKAGAGLLVLTGANSYSGGTTISASSGTLQIGNATAGSATTGIGGNLGSGTISIGSSSVLQFNKGGDTVTVTDNITGSGRVTQAGAGRLVLSGTNAYTNGTLMNVGSIVQGSDSTAYSGDSAVKSVFGSGLLGFQASSTKLELRFNGQNDASAQKLTVTTGSLQAATGGTSFTIDVDRQGGTGTGKTIATTGGFSFAMGTTAVTATTATITGANSYSLQVASVALGGGATSGYAKLNPTGANLTIAGAVTNGGTASPTVKTLILDGTTSGNAINGIIADGTGGALTTLTKQNTSTWTLGGANTYTGATLVSSGTLILNASGTLANTAITASSGGALTLGAAERINNAASLALSGGTFNTGGFSETMGALTLTNATTSSLDLGSGTSIVLFASITNNSGILNITNWTSGSDSLRFTSNANLLASSFTVNGGAASVLNQGSYYEVVPEPATWALLAFSLTTVIVLRRRTA